MKNNNKLLITLSLCTCLTINALALKTQLDEITVVSASGFEQNIAQAPASISVVTAQELQKKSYTDILDAVKNIPGVFVSGGGSEADIQIRGMGEEFTLYLVDGRPISAASTIHGDSKKTSGKIGFHLPNIDMIERIEVIRGPMSSLYGSQAMGGVINIITKKVSKKWNGSISSEYTKSKNTNSNDSKNTSLYINGPLIKETLALSLNALYEKTDESDISTSKGRKEAIKKKAGGKFIWKLDSTNTLALEYEYAKQEFNADDNNLEYGQKKSIYALTHEINTENFTLNSYLQNDKTEAIKGENQKEELLTFNTKATYFFDTHATTLGAKYKKEEYSDSINELASKIDRWSSALFLEDEWSMTDNFSLTTGIRYNYDELFKGELSPRIYGVYSFNDNITLKAGVSTGYKQPGITQTVENYGIDTGRTSRTNGLRGLEFGNIDLKPEKSLSYEIGTNYELSEFGITSSLMLYRTDYKNKMIDDYTCGTKRNSAGGCFYNGKEYNFFRQSVNVDKAQISGLELSFDYKIVPSFKISSNYSYTKSEQKSGDFKGSPLNKLPKHMYNINLDWQNTSRLNTWLQYNYRGRTSDYLSDNSISKGTPSYSFLDAGAVYDVNQSLSLKLAINNLLNKLTDEDEYGIVLDGRRVTLGLNYKF